MVSGTFLQCVLTDRALDITVEAWYEIVGIACAIHKSIEQSGPVKLPL